LTLADGVKRRDDATIRQIGEPVITANTVGVLEEYELLAGIAVKDFHLRVRPIF